MSRRLRIVAYATAMLLLFYGGIFMAIGTALLSHQGTGVLIGLVSALMIYMGVEMYWWRPWR